MLYICTFQGQKWESESLRDLFWSVAGSLITPHAAPAITYDAIKRGFEIAGRGLPSVAISGMHISTICGGV